MSLRTLQCEEEGRQGTASEGAPEEKPEIPGESGGPEAKSGKPWRIGSISSGVLLRHGVR